MGLVVDTSSLVNAERTRETAPQLIRRLRDQFGDQEVVIATISILELTHGLARAKTQEQRERRRSFIDGVFITFATEPLSLPIAERAGSISGQPATKGIVIPAGDLIIGATARTSTSRSSP